VASREFTDSNGTVWRVWDVSPSYLHPVTRTEDFMEPWAGGWLTFESALDKRRYAAPYPQDWHKYELSKLEALCRAATPVVTRRAPAAVATLANVEDAAHQDERAQAERSFSSPRGRIWTARLHECLNADGSTEMVLRFTSGDVVMDVRNWPADWKELSRDEFALLLLDADPPRRGPEGAHPRRRIEDHSAD
jgi:hypothetical protein